ncbi:unnamed protein product [Brassica napus]|uniref:(rape) hypothetical protein n=1 Tax=Brassica napus TaxID=3708 RepID=A0A816V5E9_BRANA|nr:unnamed protein product [Brassica napus]
MTREQLTEEDLAAAEALILLSQSKRQAPIHPLSSLILTPNLLESTCSLIGCSLSVQKPLKYCSTSHRNMAKIMSQELPIMCVGDCSSRDEHDSFCGCILINKSKQVQTGVPELKLPQFFSTMPNELQFVKDNPPAASYSTDYIFFHSPPLPSHQEQHGFKWVKEKDNKKFHIGSSSISSRHLCLLDPTAESWTLSLFQNANESLYCLSHVAEMNKKKIKLRKQDGKWIINKDMVSTAVSKHQTLSVSVVDFKDFLI